MSVFKKMSLYLLGLGLIFASLDLKAENSVNVEDQSMDLLEKRTCCKVNIRGATGATGATGIAGGTTGATGVTGVALTPTYSSFYSTSVNVYLLSGSSFIYETNGLTNGAVVKGADPVGGGSLFTVQVDGLYSVTFGFNVDPSVDGFGDGQNALFLNGAILPIATMHVNAVNDLGYIGAEILLSLSVGDTLTVVYTNTSPNQNGIEVGNLNTLAAWLNFVKIDELLPPI